MVVRVLDHISRCSAHEDGEIIYRIIRPILARGEKVAVSFDGISAVTSSFVNTAFIDLLDVFPFDQIKKNLTFLHSTRQINELIKKRFKFETETRPSQLAYAY